MNRSRPKVLAEGAGFHWPTVAFASGLRASSPHPDQGGSLKALMQADFVSEIVAWVIDLQSRFDRRRLAQSEAFANPTTPASAVADFLRYRGSPAPVPSPLCGSADAGGSHVTSSPTRSPTSRWWSAYADDGGRSEFPLEPPSFASWGMAAARPLIDWKGSVAALPPVRVSQARSRAGRCT
jgi:hypothetical protein